MYTTKLNVLKDVKSPDNIVSLLKELETYRTFVKSLPEGQEGLGTTLMKMVIGVADVFIRIGNTFSTNVFKFAKKLKRSELKYYTESNRLLVAAVEGTPIVKFVNQQVYMPTGMTSEYLTAIDNVDKIFKQLSINDVLKTTLNKLDDVQHLVINNDAKVSTLMTNQAILVNSLQQQLKPTIQTNKQIFTTDKSPETVAFTKAYKNMTDFKMVRERLNKLEPNLNSTMKLADTLESADARITSLINFLNSYQSDIITRSFVLHLIDVVKFLGVGFELQGNTAQQQMILEHNHVLNIDKLYKSL